LLARFNLQQFNVRDVCVGVCLSQIVADYGSRLLLLLLMMMTSFALLLFMARKVNGHTWLRKLHHAFNCAICTHL